MREENELYKYINYSSKRNICIGKKIYEYDIKQANISVLYAQGKLSDYIYERLRHSDKYSREIYIGKMIAESKDKTIDHSIKMGIQEAKREFIDLNKISEDSIVRIANDALYVIMDYPAKHTDMIVNKSLNEPLHNRTVEFVQKNCYDGYVHFSNGVWIFYTVLPDGNLDVDVIGLGNYAAAHSYMINIISTILYYLHNMQYEFAITKLSEIIEIYLQKEFPVETYREFNPLGIFRLKRSDDGIGGNNFTLYPTNVPNDMKPEQLDASYNYAILRELYSMVLSLN